MAGKGGLWLDGGMKDTLAEDLERLKGLAFGKVAERRKLVEGFNGLGEAAKRHPDYPRLKKVYPWVFVPLSLWPVDIEGFGLRVLECVKERRELDAKARLKCQLLQPPPGEAVCRMVSEYEQNVRTGSYEILLAAEHKFAQIERQVRENSELKADWEAIKGEFDVGQHRNAAGVIRRRPVQERNFHAADWRFSWKTEAEQFQNVFDVFCHKWDLYGMEGKKIPTSNLQPPEQAPSLKEEGDRSYKWEDRPLLLKLTVNITPYGTMILVPRYWSFDPRRDLKWREIKSWHRLRSAKKQGVKLGVNEVERRQEAEKAGEYWGQATAAGLRGDRRNQWVMGRLGWDPRTDDRKLRRLMAGGR